MPGNITKATAVGVLPQFLATSFSASEIFPLLVTPPYHDGTIDRFLLQDYVNLPEPLKTWKLVQRLTSTALVTLRTFFEAHGGGAIPFYFYSPVEIAPYVPTVYYDPSGGSPFGRHTVCFKGDWSETTGLALSDTGTLELVEVPDVAI